MSKPTSWQIWSAWNAGGEGALVSLIDAAWEEGAAERERGRRAQIIAGVWARHTADCLRSRANPFGTEEERCAAERAMAQPDYVVPCTCGLQAALDCMRDPAAIVTGEPCSSCDGQIAGCPTCRDDDSFEEHERRAGRVSPAAVRSEPADTNGEEADCVPSTASLIDACLGRRGSLEQQAQDVAGWEYAEEEQAEQFNREQRLRRQGYVMGAVDHLPQPGEPGAEYDEWLLCVKRAAGREYPLKKRVPRVVKDPHGDFVWRLRSVGVAVYEDYFEYSRHGGADGSWKPASSLRPMWSAARTRALAELLDNPWDIAEDTEVEEAT